MKGLINFLKTEVNPKNDTESIKDSLGMGQSNPQTLTELVSLKGSQFYSVAKPFIRGGIVGAASGTIFSLFDGKIARDVVIGTMSGLALDSIQYSLRTVYYFYKKHVF